MFPRLGGWGEHPKREHATGPLPVRQFTPAFRIYDLRHTCCSVLLANGVPVNVVADIMGHEKASFTFARYGHALKKDTQAAVAKMEAVLFGTGRSGTRNLITLRGRQFGASCHFS